MAEMPRRAREEGSAWIKRKVCGTRDVSVAEAACLPQPLLALGPATSQRIPRKAKDRDIASLCARTPFPSFIYLCLPAASNALALSSSFLRLFHYSSVGQFTLAPSRPCALRSRSYSSSLLSENILSYLAFCAFYRACMRNFESLTQIVILCRFYLSFLRSVV